MARGLDGEGRWRGRLANAALVVVSPFALLGVLEAAAWLAGVEPLAGDADYRAAHDMRVCRFAGDELERACRAERLAGGSRAVVALGGSSVRGHPPGETRPFPRHLRDALARARPGAYAVHNLGFACKDSAFVRSCFERIAPARPAFAVVYSGHNDTGLVTRYPRALMLLQRRGAFLVDLEGAAAASRAYSAVARLVPGAGGGKADLLERLPPDVEARSREVVLAAYADNLQALIDTARGAGTRVLLVTLVSNLHEYPIRRSDWDLALDDHAYPSPTMRLWQQHYRRGVGQFRGGRFEEALASFKRARDSDLHGRAPSAMNALLRELATAHAHVHLVDFERELERAGLDTGLGCNFFGTETWCDQLHPNPRTQRMLGAAVARALLALDSNRSGVP